MADRVADLVRAATAQVQRSRRIRLSVGTAHRDRRSLLPESFQSGSGKNHSNLEAKESKGLVVQGPPGTGKKVIDIANTCHGLASGWRILVAAHSDGPLQVLKGNAA